jgi:hypothetical protein
MSVRSGVEPVGGHWSVTKLDTRIRLIAFTVGLVVRPSDTYSGIGASL